MYSLQRFWVNFSKVYIASIIFLLSALTGEVFAQDNNAPHFNYEVNQFFSTGNFLHSVDHATIWGSAGSAWILKADQNISAELTQYFERFEWNGSKIFFKTKFCSEDIERPRPLTLKGHIDFSQSNKYAGNKIPQRVILSTDQGAASRALKGNCILISEISSYLDGRVMFKADSRGEDTVTIDIYNSGTKKVLRLVYEPDYTFEPLARNSWKIRPDNDAPKCALLGFSRGGRGGTSCCNSLSFKVTKTTEGWLPNGGYQQTLRACGGYLSGADGLMTRALSQGLKINEDGNLIAGAESDTPYIFDPVTGFEKAEGVWTLSGLEYRRFDSRVFTMPHVTRVRDETAIRELGVLLTVSPKQLKIQAGCNSAERNIVKIKPGFIRMEGKSVSFSDFCNAKEMISNIPAYKLMSIIGGPVLKVDFNERTQTLTLTKSSIGSYGRSHSWIFSR